MVQIYFQRSRRLLHYFHPLAETDSPDEEIRFSWPKRILQTTEPRWEKKLGRQVKSFNDEKWSHIREKAVEEGNWTKFTTPNNRNMKQILLDTGDRELCEASSKDRIWGIGYKEKDARPMVIARKKEKWGSNLLGKALMRVREWSREGVARQFASGLGNETWNEART
ncbi:DUF1768-domain-containing protein [Rhizodiscina lignyota]|uniref:DUF1768-domain-containing protein n=1 Tax=Rhizodiscina lignyota TaxID=1504668 RepID=A0A9P4I814_9PEZI|nr:DUF1768-domain-containing protein [Rhizodiscina lignyota]